MGEVLNEAQIYEGGDVSSRRGVELSEIKYTVVSLVQLSDVSLLARCTGLRVIGLRMCSLAAVPSELLGLELVESVDLSGNMIEGLPGPGSYARWTRLRALNLSDNGIRELSEIEKMKEVTSLKMLNLVGNVCVSANNSFGRVAAWFPAMVVLNETIITSQFRASLCGMAVSDKNATLPLSKTDDYYFLFVRYMHVVGQERYVRKLNAQFFCVNRLVRRYSAADKIQSVFRGFLVRRSYKMALSAGVFIRDFVRYWYHRRMVAADKIQRAFLHHLLKQKIKMNACARKIQSTWERYRDRQATIVRVFETEGKYQFFVSRDDLDSLRAVVKANDLKEPETVEPSEYRIVRRSREAIKTSRLPGTPVIWYFVDQGFLIRSASVKSMSRRSIWCGHSHDGNTATEEVVSQSGVNWSKLCCFGTLKPKACEQQPKSVKWSEYPSLMKCSYSDINDFTRLITVLVRTQSHGITVFTEATLRAASAQFRIQAACRCFLVRIKHFKSMKKMVLEERAALAIQRFFRRERRRQALRLAIETLQYHRSLPQHHSFFIPKNALLQMASRSVKRNVAFGFSTDKDVILVDSHEGVLSTMIPQGRAAYPGHDLSSLFKIGAVASLSQSTTFNNRIPAKWLKRCSVMKIIFGSVSEAQRRLTLFAYLTGDTRTIMSEADVLPYCAACSIQCGWIGFTSRRLITHMGAQQGRKMNMVCLVPRDSSGQRVAINENRQNSMSQEELTIEDQIAYLRNNYQTWRKGIEQYKAMNSPSEAKAPKDTPEEAQKKIGPGISFENMSQNKQLNDESLPKPLLSRRAIHTSKQSRTWLQSVKNIIPFLYETESDKTFAMRLTDKKLRLPSAITDAAKARPRTSQAFHQTGSPGNQFAIIGTASAIPPST